MTIHLVLKHCWYDMICSGNKIEEYREIKPYYEKLANLRKGDKVIFHKGYTNICIEAEVRYCYKAYGVPSWGGNTNKLQWVIGFRIICGCL